MPHLTRQQEKAMFAKKGNVPTRSNVNPVVFERGKLSPKKRKTVEKGLRALIAGLKEKRRIGKEQKGRQRIESEKLALKIERITAERLREELEVEQAREAVAQQRGETQAEFRKIETARRERKLAPIRKLVAGAIQAGKKVEKATRPRPVRRRKRKVKEEIGFFGI